MSRLPTDDPDSDLDDLDDLLPSFSAPGPSALPSLSSAAPPPALAASHRPPAAPAAADEDDDNDEAFATELAANMERMLADLSAPSPPLPSSASTSPAAGRRAPAPPADEGASWEAAFAQALAGELGPAPSGATATAAGAASGAGTGPTPPGGLKDTVRETMERLRASAEQSDGAAPDDPLAALLASLGLDGSPSSSSSRPRGPAGAGEDGDEGEDGESDDGLLERMMDGLMSRDVLYEPMRELRDKYPPYLASPTAAALQPAQLHSYRLQSTLVSQIVDLFDSPAYASAGGRGDAGADAGVKAEIQELMGKMQDLGSPPREVMGDMPDFDVGPDGLPALPEGMDVPEGCVIG